MNLIADQNIVLKIKKTERIVILTGAGISAESGIPTFRGKNGLWTKLSPEELASFESFYKNTEMVLEWYKYRKEIIKHSQPNGGHIALSRLSRIPKHFDLITQNIDGLHQQAGNHDVIELHGNIFENYCIRCGQNYDSEQFDEIFDSSPNHIPRCFCGGLIRPNVVWFGEALPRDNLEKAYSATMDADVFISVGTSGLVRPAADLPIVAKQSGACLIEVNIQPTVLSHEADLVLLGAAGQILPMLVEDFKEILSEA